MFREIYSDELPHCFGYEGVGCAKICHNYDEKKVECRQCGFAKHRFLVI